jgi:hypothetical protein
MSKVIFFDWDKGEWQVIQDDGTIIQWDGVTCDDANNTHEYPILPSGTRSNMDQSTWSCLHDWATYDSGFRTFEYCTKCDVKRGQ